MVCKRDLFRNDDKRLPSGAILLATQPILYCRECGMTYSADPADYWLLEPGHVMVCEDCDRQPMELVYKRVRYEDAL